MKVKTWLISWLFIVITILGFMGYCVYKVDPYFHYHKPYTDKYFYLLYNQRSQNSGIARHFEYDTLVTGTSLTEDIYASQVDELFGCKSIKVPFSGGSYKEVNDLVKIALEANPELKRVIRCFDMFRFLDEYDLMRTDLGKFPTYLYDKNPFNDVEYLLNRDVLGRVYQMYIDSGEYEPGITSFDDYCRWPLDYIYGINEHCPEGLSNVNIEQKHLSETEKEIIRKNITMNVTDTVNQYPEVEFYYYYSPYSIAEWNEWQQKGMVLKILEAEEYITEMLVACKNIHLFSFNVRTDIIADMNNYRDFTHYGEWVNNLIIKWLHDEKYRITKDNYKEFLQQEYDIYATFDYESINGQNDYEADYYAAALVNQELTGAEPIDVLEQKIELIDGKGNLSFTVDLDKGYNYLVFNLIAKDVKSGFAIDVYNEEGDCIESLEKDSSELDGQTHQYVIDLLKYRGVVNVEVSGDAECLYAGIF